MLVSESPFPRTILSIPTSISQRVLVPRTATVLALCLASTSWRGGALSLSPLSLTQFSTLSRSAYTCWSTSPLFAVDTTAAMSSSATAVATTDLLVAQFPSRSDNYGYLLHDPVTGATAAVDTPDAHDYQQELVRRGWNPLTHIFNTHHHHDHVGGNLALKRHHQDVIITGPVGEQNKIPGIDRAVEHGDEIQFGSIRGVVMDVGGHTKGHVAYYFPDQKKVFVGDALFSLGCGRMFEGTPSQFWASLQRLRDLPDDTMIYCAHEYTSSNAKFALSVEPNNPDLQARAAIVQQKRERGEPTVPSLLGEEKKANPFLRVDFSDDIRRNIGVTASDSDAQAFGKLRKAKDRF